MELLVLLAIVAVGGIWWLNHTMKKNAEREAARASKPEEAPYKVEVAEVKIEPAPVVVEAPAVPVAPVVEEPKAEEKPKKVRTPSKGRAVSTSGAKKPRASKAKKAAPAQMRKKAVN